MLSGTVEMMNMKKLPKTVLIVDLPAEDEAVLIQLSAHRRVNSFPNVNLDSAERWCILNVLSTLFHLLFSLKIKRTKLS